MNADFDTTPRIYAFSPEVLATVPDLIAQYGAELPETPKKPNSPVTRCIAGGQDRQGSDDLRSLSHPTTASTTPLTDGRHAFRAYWSLAILAAVESGEVVGEELTEEQFQSLRYVPAEIF